MHVKIELFTLSFGFIFLVAEAGCKLSRAVYLAPHLSIDSLTFYDHSTCFKLSEYKVASNAVIMHVKYSCLPGHSVSYAWLQRWGGQAVQGGLSCPPPPPHLSMMVKLFMIISTV